MFDALVIPPPHSETHRIPYLVHDALDVWAQFLAWHIDEHGFVAARDVVTNSRRADRVFIGNDSANRDGVALVVIGHQRNPIRRPRASLDLRNRASFRIAPNGNSINELHFSLLLWGGAVSRHQRILQNS